MSRARRTLPAAVVGLACALATVPATGDEERPSSIDGPASEGPRLALDYVVDVSASSCEPAASFRARVAERLGRDPFREPATARAHVIVSRHGAAFRAQLRVESLPSGRTIGGRRIDGGSCPELLDAVALSLGLALEVLAVEAEEPVAPVVEPVAPVVEHVEPVVERAAEPVVERAIEPGRAEPPAPARTVHTPTRLSVLLGPGLSVGAGPKPSIGVRAGLALAHEELRALLGGRYELPTDVDVGGGGGIAVGLITGELAACYAPDLWFGCAGVSAGVHRGIPRALDRSHTVSTPYVAAGARAGLAVSMTRAVAVRFELLLDVELTRTTLRVSEQPAWTTPAVNGGLGVSLEWAPFGVEDRDTEADLRPSSQ
ncbi:hypothetical protein L6R52_33040 [Myxococcota bacterium]|nr:hypothetical protein [Myxococcota bacterium]